MKKLIGLGALLVACHAPATPTPSPTSSTTATAGGTGATSPAAAVASFLAASKAEDIQAIGAIWGDAQGPAREQMQRSEFEMRAFYIVKCTRNDSFTVLSEAKAASGEHVMSVQIKRGDLTKTTNFTVVAGPQGRWYVKTVDLNQLNAICQKA